MTQSIIPRERVAEQFAVPVRVLFRYEARGLVRAVRDDVGVEGYGPTEVRRVWTILSCRRDLGINLAGVEAILKLRDHLEEVHQRLHTVARELHEALEGESEHTHEHEHALDDDART